MRALRVLQRHGEAVRERVKGDVAGCLAGAQGAADLARAARRAHAALDEEGGRALARSHAPAPACSAGCSYCCHVHVDATVPEILAVAAHVAATWAPAALDALRRALSRRAGLVERMTDEERWRAKIPCALLGDGGRCAIYDVRPLRCRAFHARSVEPCREAFAGRGGSEPELEPALERAHDAVEAGYDRALLEAGWSADGHRLETALLIALEDPEAFARTQGRASEPTSLDKAERV